MSRHSPSNSSSDSRSAKGRVGSGSFSCRGILISRRKSSRKRRKVFSSAAQPAIISHSWTDRKHPAVASLVGQREGRLAAPVVLSAPSTRLNGGASSVCEENSAQAVTSRAQPHAKHHGSAPRIIRDFGSGSQCCDVRRGRRNISRDRARTTSVVHVIIRTQGCCSTTGWR